MLLPQNTFIILPRNFVVLIVVVLNNKLCVFSYSCDKQNAIHSAGGAEAAKQRSTAAAQQHGSYDAVACGQVWRG